MGAGGRVARTTSASSSSGTTTPDTIFPSTACLLQDKIGATQAWGFDLGAACSGFTYALTTGDADGRDAARASTRSSSAPT